MKSCDVNSNVNVAGYLEEDKVQSLEGRRKPSQSRRPGLWNRLEMMVAWTAILNEWQLSGEKGPGSPLLNQLSSRSERQLRACEIPHVSIRKNWITFVETERYRYGGRRLKALYMLHLRCLLENNVYISRYSCKYNSIRTSSCLAFISYGYFFLARANKLLYGAGEFCIDSFCVVFKILAWYHLLPSSVKILSISFPLNEERSMNMTVASLAKPMGQSSWGCVTFFLTSS